MGGGDVEPVGVVTEPFGCEMTVARPGEVITLDGPQRAIDRRCEGDPALRRARRVEPAAMGALATLIPLLQDLGGAAGGTKAVFQLDAVGPAVLPAGELTFPGDGFVRLFAQGADGQFAGHGVLQAVPGDAGQLASAQLATVTIALTAAIEEVQDAVEWVEDKVDVPRDADVAELEPGDVPGALPAPTGDVEQAEPGQAAGRFSKLRSSAMSRIGWGGDDSVDDDLDGVDRESSAVGEH